MDSAIKTPFGRAVFRRFLEMLKEDCFGCKNDRNSQIEHDVCLMMDSGAQVIAYFDYAYDDILDSDPARFMADCKGEPEEFKLALMEEIELRNT